MFKLEKLEITRNPFIGLYLSANNAVLLHPPNLPEKSLSTLIETLSPELTCAVLINSSPLVGLYSVLNSNGIVLPDLISEKELLEIKKLGLNVCLLPSNFAAIRNNVLATDRICLVNPHVPEKLVAEMRECLGVEVLKHSISHIPTIGAVNAANNNGALAYNNASIEETEKLSSLLKCKIIRGTTNLGSIANSYGVVANDKGAVIGGLSSGFEVANAFEALSSD